MDRAYVDTLRLLLAIAPHVFRRGVFAMKGGTALNLFVHDLPRVSVDIDLVYADWSVSRDAALKVIEAELTAIAGRLKRLGHSTRPISTPGGDESKLLIERGGAQVKVEVNLVFRGTVRPVQQRSLGPRAAEMFSADLSVPTLVLDELYGSKIVAALDRQHPRDLFDIWQLYETHGLTDETIACFVLYLAGHNRPLHEVLSPRRKEIAREFEASFKGMTREPVELVTLQATRSRLLADIPRRLTADQRTFLIGLGRGQPDWSLAGCPHARELPAIRWRLQNLEQLRAKRPREFDRQAQALEDALSHT